MPLGTAMVTPGTPMGEPTKPCKEGPMDKWKAVGPAPVGASPSPAGAPRSPAPLTNKKSRSSLPARAAGVHLARTPVSPHHTADAPGRWKRIPPP